MDVCRWLIAVGLLLPSGAVGIGGEPDWVAAMRRVHAASEGEPGVLVHLGDSITDSMAYFAPLQYADDAKMPLAVAEAYRTVDGYMNTECYRWKGPERGNQGGQTAAWARPRLDRWVETLHPEVAVVMFGTNDIRRVSVEAHARHLRDLVQTSLERGVVVILCTIPPMQGWQEKVQQTVEAQRKIARDLNVPLIDLYAHVINRRPHDWNGKLPRFESHTQWEVPTIISSDGVHLSNPQRWRSDYTEQGLCRNGNGLRSYLTLMAYSEVIDVIIKGGAPGKISATILGANPPKPDDLPVIETGTEADAPESGGPNPQALTTLPHRDWFPKAPSLEKPSGDVIRVDSSDALYVAADNVRPGGTILVAPGRYRLPQTLVLSTDDVTLRSSSGDRAQVVLDFSECRDHEGIAISHCSGVTVADLTVSNVRQNGIKINSNLGVDGVTIYNVISHNVWQRHVKGPKVPDKGNQPAFVKDCRIQYCLFYNDRPKRPGDDPWEDANRRMGFNYIGGIDVMGAKDWVISDNEFTGIHGRTGEVHPGLSWLVPQLGWIF